MTTLITADALAERLGVNRNWIYRRVQLNLIPHVRLPGSSSVRFDPDAIEPWLAAGRMDGTGPTPRTAR